MSDSLKGCVVLVLRQQWLGVSIESDFLSLAETGRHDGLDGGWRMLAWEFRIEGER